jgi:1-acyl-sn-glycerol-3-phosphate acyltransferase
LTDAPSDVRHEVFGPEPARDLARLIRSGTARPLWRLAAVAAWTVGGLVTLLPGLALLAPWRRGRLAWRQRIVRLWARGLGRIMGMKVAVHGPRPRRPFFLVCNHLSYVDIVLLLGELDTVFVAKRELGDWPVLGFLSRLAGTIFVDRRRRRDAVRVLRAIETAVGAGYGVVVFPEGTSSAGDDVYPLRPALFEWAARTGHPVHVAALRYETPPGTPPAREVICWWGTMTFMPHVLGLLRLRGFRASLRFAPEPLTGADRSDLADRARALIAAGLAADPPLETA